MRNELKRVAAVVGLTVAMTSAMANGEGEEPNGGTAPPVFLLDAKHLQLTRQRAQAGDKNLTPAWATLTGEAQKALSVLPSSLVSKEAMPPTHAKPVYTINAPYLCP